MTEEEFFISNYPDSCYGDRPLSPHWDFFQDGVEFGERKSEKQIEIDAKQIRALQKQNGELTDRLETGIALKDEEISCILTDFNTFKSKAKEIIKYLLSFIQKENYRTRWDINIEEAEQFLKEE